MRSVSENALIAIERPKRTRMPSLEFFKPAQARMAFIEFSIKGVAIRVARAQPGQRAHVFRM
jgi:hypothetical protein